PVSDYAAQKPQSDQRACREGAGAEAPAARRLRARGQRDRTVAAGADPRPLRLLSRALLRWSDSASSILGRRLPPARTFRVRGAVSPPARPAAGRGNLLNSRGNLLNSLALIEIGASRQSRPNHPLRDDAVEWKHRSVDVKCA